jgi:hypothetical protein
VTPDELRDRYPGLAEQQALAVALREAGPWRRSSPLSEPFAAAAGGLRRVAREVRPREYGVEMCSRGSYISPSPLAQ